VIVQTICNAPSGWL